MTCNTVITTPADVCVRVVGTKGYFDPSLKSRLQLTQIVAGPSSFPSRPLGRPPSSSAPTRQMALWLPSTRRRLSISLSRVSFILSTDSTGADYSSEGFGLHWEADAVARSLRDGEKENPRMPHAGTLLTMKVCLPSSSPCSRRLELVLTDRSRSSSTPGASKRVTSTQLGSRPRSEFE